MDWVARACAAVALRGGLEAAEAGELGPAGALVTRALPVVRAHLGPAAWHQLATLATAPSQIASRRDEIEAAIRALREPASHDPARWRARRFR
jgi:hypothetical protein